MGHRSSKISAGLTNGNKNSIKETSSSTKLTKHSSRRHSSRRFSKTSSTANSESGQLYRNSIASLTSTNVAAVYGDKFLPILRLDSDTIAETSNLSSVASNSTGQIIIKIHFKTHTPEMDNTQQNILQPTAESHAHVVANSDTYRRLVDTNSNKVPHTDAGVVEAAGSSINSMLNNNNANSNRASLPNNLNVLRITEPLVEQAADRAGNVEYYEIMEENTATTHNRPSVSSRRQKAKSAFMNLKSMLESSSSSSGSNKLNKLSNSNNNNHCNDSSANHSRNTSQAPPVTAEAHLRQKQLRPSNSEVRMSLPTVSTSSCQRDSAVSNVNSLTTSTHTPTPVSITTSSAAQPTPTVTATNEQLAVWASNKDLIISSINVVVCPTTTTTSATATAITSKPAERVPTAQIGNVIRNESESVVGEKCNSNPQRTNEGRDHTNISQTSITKNAVHVLSTATSPIVHSQVDFVHYLVPDLERIFNSSFYWGKMDRYEAERLLEGKSEGTFLLRDSAQEEYLFSVTFRKYGRSLHARIEQSGHKFR